MLQARALCPSARGLAKCRRAWAREVRKMAPVGLAVFAVGAVAAGPPSALLIGGPSDARRAAEDSIVSLRGHLDAFCADASPDCVAWAQMGECRKNSAFMETTCRKACNACVASQADRINFAEVALIALRSVQLARAAANVGPWEEAHVLEATLYGAQSAPSGALMGALPAIADAMQGALDGLPPASAPFPARGAPTPQREGDGGKARSMGGRFVVLNDGHTMPALGFGTWLLTGDAAYRAVRLALELGFRHIDTSENYLNEGEVGRALRDSAVPRSELFVATKLSLPSSYGGPQARQALERSLAALGLDYVDLYMLHGPHSDPAVLAATWRALEAAKAEGLILSLGVSNFGLAELRALDAIAPSVRPATVQNKHSVYRHGSSFTYEPQPSGTHGLLAELRGAAPAGRNATLTAYCTLNAWPGVASPLHDARVRALAAELGVTPAQLLLRWAVETGGSALTRATSREHALENVGSLAFELRRDTLVQLNALRWLARAPWNRGAAEWDDEHSDSRVAQPVGGEAVKSKMEL